MTIVLADSSNPIVQGEKIDPLVYQFLDASGQPINLLNYQVKFSVRENSAAAGSLLNGGLVDPASGTVIYTWTGTEFPTPGHYQMEFWVGNGNQRYCSELITAVVRCPVGLVPAI